ncbi:MAG: hypothetical protein H6R19_1906 [Proteobacteria bacterium]|nr:hypothetical protein [Pseudomonadota bacterium]
MKVLNNTVTVLALQGLFIVGGFALNTTLAVRPALAQVAAATLSTQEQAGLRFMREEEKLARDVYAALSAKWKLPIFGNIAQSEQTHMDALLSIVTRYGITDPALKAAGKFSDPALQSLYDQLVADGSQSLQAALKVGAAIEEIDIRDLDEKLAGVKANDLRLTYENLRSASYKHLQSFTRQLQQQGVSYTPQYLSPEAYARAQSNSGRGGPAR